MNHVLVFEEKDKNGNMLKRTYYAETKVHPKHQGPDGLEFTLEGLKAYQFASKEYAENFRGGHEELKAFVAQPTPRPVLSLAKEYTPDNEPI